MSSELVVALADPDLDAAVQGALGPSLRLAAEGFDAALVPDMVDDDHTSWDVCATDFAAGNVLGRAGLLEEIDFTRIPRGGAPWWGVPAWVSRLVLVSAGGPMDWAGFYDTTRVGSRAMPADLVVGVLETALLADGVAPEKLYPLDVERGFARLTALRPQMVFWRNGAQARALMTDGAIAGAVYSYTAKTLRDADGRFGWGWPQSVLVRTLWVVPKGGPAGVAPAMQFIGATQAPERQAALLRLCGCGPDDPAPPGAGIAAREAWYIDNALWLLARWHALVQG